MILPQRELAIIRSIGVEPPACGWRQTLAAEVGIRTALVLDTREEGDYLSGWRYVTVRAAETDGAGYTQVGYLLDGPAGHRLADEVDHAIYGIAR